MVNVKTLEKVKVNVLVDAVDNKVVEVEVEKLAKTLPELEARGRVDTLLKKVAVAEVRRLVTQWRRCRRWC